MSSRWTALPDTGSSPHSFCLDLVVYDPDRPDGRVYHVVTPRPQRGMSEKERDVETSTTQPPVAVVRDPLWTPGSAPGAPHTTRGRFSVTPWKTDVGPPVWVKKVTSVEQVSIRSVRRPKSDSRRVDSVEWDSRLRSSGAAPSRDTRTPTDLPFLPIPLLEVHSDVRTPSVCGADGSRRDTDNGGQCGTTTRHCVSPSGYSGRYPIVSPPRRTGGRRGPHSHHRHGSRSGLVLGREPGSPL